MPQFTNQEVIIKHYARVAIVAQSPVGPAIVPDQTDGWCQLDDLGRIEPDESPFFEGKASDLGSLPDSGLAFALSRYPIGLRPDSGRNARLLGRVRLSFVQQREGHAFCLGSLFLFQSHRHVDCNA